MATGEKKMSREDAAELYQDLQKAMKKMKGGETKKKSAIDSSVAKQIAEAIRAGMKKDDELKGASKLSDEELLEEEEVVAPLKDRKKSRIPHMPMSPTRNSSFGSQWAISLIVFILLSKITLSGLEASGVLGVPEAQATLQGRASLSHPSSFSQQYTPEEVAVLKALDATRVKLEERKEKLGSREREIDLKEEALVSRLAELRDLTEKLQSERKKSEGRRNSQLEQLSNVYGSMNPKEAAQLIEQLDVTIALRLLERMPEKRIGQILSLMSPERALTITRMLSGGKGSLRR